MIIIDKNEEKKQTRLPNIKGAFFIEGMEEWSGADVIITDKLPDIKDSKVNTKSLQQICREGKAYLIQIKYGYDLIASNFDNRVKEAMRRMIRYTKFPSQRILLGAGVYQSTKSGVLVIDGKKRRQVNFFSYLNTLDSWNRSGTSIIVPSSQIQKWLLSKEGRGGANNEQKYVLGGAKKAEYIEGDLGLSERITDGRLLLSSIPGVGPGRATKIYDHFNKSLIESILFLLGGTDEAVEGVGKVTIQKARDFFGLLEDEKVIFFKSGGPVKVRWPEGVPYLTDLGKKIEEGKDGVVVKYSYDDLIKLKEQSEVIKIQKEIHGD